MNDYNLIYTRKSDQKIFHVKRIDNSEYSLKDPITGEKEKITSHFLKKQYECVTKFSEEARKKKLDFSFLQVREKQLA